MTSLLKLQEQKDAYTVIFRNKNEWIKINYVDDALYYASSQRVREHFKISLKKFNLTLLGIAKWYLGMRIVQKAK